MNAPRTAVRYPAAGLSSSLEARRLLFFLLLLVAGFVFSAGQARAAGMGAEDARHLLNRTGFEAHLHDIDKFARLGRREAVERLLGEARHAPRTPAPEWVSQWQNPRRIRQMGEEERKLFQRELIERGMELRRWWLAEMLATPSPLTERMTLFWHNHDISWDEGATWDYINTMAVGQFYAVGVDMRKPYFVCGGLQDNGSFCGPSATRSPNGITNADWYRVGGGDGFYNLVDPTDYNIVYTESQNGNRSRLDLRTGERANIRPRARPRQQPPGALQTATSNIVPEPPAGETYRWNWSTPIQISPHDPATIYTGANKLFKSANRGDTWTASQDLTKQIDRDNQPTCEGN